MNIDKVILKFIWRGKIPRTATHQKENQVGGLTLSDLAYSKRQYSIQCGICKRTGK